VVSFTPRPLYLQGKRPWYPSDRRLGGPQSRSGRGDEEKNSQPLSGVEPPIFQSVAQRFITGLFRLLIFNYTEDISEKKFRESQLQVFWVATPYSVVVGYQRFRALCCFHLQEASLLCSVVVGYQRFRALCCLHLQKASLLCSVVVGYLHFRGPCCLHLQETSLLCTVLVGYLRFRDPC
jgi:hypothetical protein